MKSNDVKSAEDFLNDANNIVTYMTCEDYKNAIKRDVDHVLLDVRSKEEFDEGHIDEAIHLPRGVIEFEVEKRIPNRNTPIMVCCQSGRRAALAAKTLYQMGYSDVRVLEGGFMEFCKLDEE